VVSELDMPPIDMESTLEQIFTTVINVSEFSDKIAYTGRYMASGEGIFEGLFENSEAELHDDVSMRINLAVVHLGNAIKNKLTDYNAYRQDRFPYFVRNYINDRTIVLSKSTELIPSE
jgi:hypothetical protein